MSMDLYGLNPKSIKGFYFKNGNWAWFPLWNYVQQVGPSVASKVLFPFENCGDGLCEKDAEELAAILRQMVDEGHTLKYSETFEEWKASGAESICVFCMGSGHLEGGQRLISTDDKTAIKTEVTLADNIICPACEGEPKSAEITKQFRFGVENIQSFIDFLEACGGFVIT
jgi:hypothetical protein